MIDVNQILSYGGTFMFSGFIGAVMGYFTKKIIKLALLIGGGILVLLAFLQYKGVIDVKWNVVQVQSEALLNNTAHTVLNTFNSTAQHLYNNGVQGVYIGYPIVGIIGFVPGFFIGFAKG